MIVKAKEGLCTISLEEAKILLLALDYKPLEYREREALAMMKIRLMSAIGRREKTWISREADPDYGKVEREYDWEVYSI